ncbi:hypothetical protein QCO44_04710 [Selenomonas sputigena]|uniref:Uncharacterized protein n=1 Tax=Selenomonas sputigena TaxID=69823 RepID=A0ABV3X427_9FIRM
MPKLVLGVSGVVQMRQVKAPLLKVRADAQRADDLPNLGFS